LGGCDGRRRELPVDLKEQRKENGGKEDNAKNIFLSHIFFSLIDAIL
jgi:hypothetical protein